MFLSSGKICMNISWSLMSRHPGSERGRRGGGGIWLHGLPWDPFYEDYSN